ncbi:MAG: tetratricopeptide repeat protein [Legionellales bacterium]|nr:tetratricopeptide repeat protein [Legionellales bacterium]
MIKWVILLLVTSCALILVYWPLRKQRTVWLWILCVLGLAGLGYWYWGSWPAQARFTRHLEREKAAEIMLRTVKKPGDLIATLQQHLQKNPRSARGWYLLGRLYASQQIWDKAHAAFAKAYELKPHDDLIAVNYAQSLLARRQGDDAAVARGVLSAVLKRHPQQMDALMLLAIDAQQRHAVQEALAYWRRLLILVPDQSPEADSIRKAIHELDGS